MQLGFRQLDLRVNSFGIWLTVFRMRVFDVSGFGIATMILSLQHVVRLV